MTVSDFDSAITGLNQLAYDFAASGPILAAKVDTITIATAHLIEGNAKQIVPVDTGATKNSIGVDIERHGEGPGYGTEAIIGAQTSYAVFLELGTERMAPMAFLGPSLDRYSGAYEAGLAALASEFGGPL